MKRLFPLLFTLLSTLTLAQTEIKVATFDSGFGGYFTAKEIEKQIALLQENHSANFSINHYGDTLNAPYGEKTPEMIADYSARGISRAFDDGAEVVFIACNTASTQYEAIKSILDKKNPGRGDHIVSIIDSSVRELKKQIDEHLKRKDLVQVVILATPATIRAGAYLRAISSAFGLNPQTADLKVFNQERWFKEKGEKIDSVSSQSILKLPKNQRVIISQIGPGNWVDMIEHGATQALKETAVGRDLRLLAPKTSWDIVGEFCTHYPAVDYLIKAESQKLKLSSEKTSYIKQGPLMAEIFRKMMLARLKPKKSKVPMKPVRAKIFISGKNAQETAELAREIFPKDPAPMIEQKSF